MQTSKTFKVLAFLCFSLILSNVHAQIDSFKLSDYKLADYKRQGIDLNFNLSGSNSNYEITSDTDNSNNKTNSFGNFVSGRYFLDINNRKYQGNHGIYLSNDLRLFNNENDNYDHKETDISSLVNIFSTNRFYGKKDYYFSLDIHGNIYSDDRIYQWNSDTTEFHKTMNLISSGIGIGKGRIETVTDARHTLYILNELKKSNRLIREPTHDEIYKLSEHITKALNERVLDSRLKKIYELTVIDSVLLDMDLIETTDMVYFSNLNDMWDFGGNQYRTSGFRMELAYNPTYQFVIENEINSPAIEMNSNSNSFIHNFVYIID